MRTPLDNLLYMMSLEIKVLTESGLEVFDRGRDASSHRRRSEVDVALNVHDEHMQILPYRARHFELVGQSLGAV